MDDIKELKDGLENNVRILNSFVRSIPEDALLKRRRPDLWTVAEHVEHLAEAQSMLYDRLEAFQNISQPRFEPYFPDDDAAAPPASGPIDIEGVLQQFARWRGKQVLLIDSMDAAAWQKRAEHPEYRDYSLYILVRHILMHDHWHLYRMEELWLTREAYLTS